MLLLLVGWGASARRSLPAPMSASAPEEIFSAERAGLSVHPFLDQARPPGSPAHDGFRARLLERLAAMGLQGDVQVRTVTVSDPPILRSATVRNVVARIAGSAPTGAVLLSSHYDTRALPSPADVAADAMGVTTVLEAVRALLAGGPLRNDLIVLLADAHHLGGLGRRAFMDEHPWGGDVGLVISLDPPRAGGPAVVYARDPVLGLGATSGGAGPRPLWTALPRPTPLSGESAFTEVNGTTKAVQELAVSTWKTTGAPTAAADAAIRSSARTQQQMGDEVLRMLRRVGETPLGAVTTPDAARITFSLPLLGVRAYSSAWLLPTSLALLVGWLVLVRLAGPRGSTVWGVGVGLLTGVLSVALGAGTGWLLLKLLGDVHPEYGTLPTAYYRDGPPTLALGVLVMLGVSLLHALARRWFRAEHLAVGALAIPVGVCVGLTFGAPEMAPVVQWPLLAALLGAAWFGAFGAERAWAGWRWLLAFLATASVVFLTLPALELLAGTATFRVAPMLGGVFGAASLMVLPVLLRLSRPRAWWLPTTAVTTAVLLLTSTLPALQGARAHPTQTALSYLTERSTAIEPSGTSMAGLAPPSPGPSRTRGHWLTVPGPGEAWARSWVGQAVSGPDDPGDALLEGGPWRIIGTGPDAEVQEPLVTVSEGPWSLRARDIRVTIRSRLGGEMTGIRLPDGVEGEITSLTGTQWRPGDRPVRALMHWGRPEDDDLTVGIVLYPSTHEPVLQVIEHHLRPKEILGDYFFQRADSIVPTPSVGSDRVIQRTWVSVGDATARTLAGGR